ncbi:aldehyde dehydrogenase [Paraburkholderia rhynchosiae]|uniref:(Z)-2-((N-methylformamido)methylene)-5-hydroxybutyrolactone dehydrogenase n=1 Tax=Paraburkholderia rhynchosiae TaxID=487049 RepID=A0A2N7W7V7_9BURK|nr:aldehyde dehydrogenase [Paraburkholderia rhynchosiae]PMS25485.1 carnitine dehydratase [Paraburkholderia rhynchosiae]CAB3733987.1 (Z)-2-((N-methylformamido)methylene)-5-hydroxybutyrolactone dehydrogenase [Paraburkholderia rhynchosiae]
MQTFHMRIGGKDCEAQSGQWFDSSNPYTGETWAKIPRGGAEDVDAAVKAAHDAFRSGPWSTMTATNRGALLRALGDAIAANAEKLAELEVLDNGKLRAEMLGQMNYLPQWFYYYGGLADKVEGAVTPIDKPGMFHYVQYEPLGVVGVIAPWNSPLLLAVWKIAPALAAGNTVVVKPSEFSSASTIFFARLCDEAGIPPGVVNVITGFGREVGEPLVKHPLVARIGFTGSDAGGRKVNEAAAKDFKRVSMELGGKSANIVFEDADLDAAARGAISGIFAATGQTCMAGSRLLVQRSIHDRFVEKLVEVVGKARLGDPSSPDTDVGPVSTPPQLDKVLQYIEIARSEGAVCALGGERSKRPGCEKGFFVEPTIFTNVNNQMRIAREEVFGPVLSVIPFEDEDEAVAIANDSPYGLAAGVWTSNLRRAMMLPKRIHAGTVWVNAYRVVSYMAPFGGVKSSGLGRENGLRAIFEFLETKSVFINTVPREGNPFVLG